VTTQPADALALPETAPSTQPTTEPVATTGPTTIPSIAAAAVASPGGIGYSGRTSGPASRILPAAYMILAERSIFQKGSHISGPEQPIQTVIIPTTNPVATGDPTSISDSAEESLVFDGATESGSEVLAFVEDRVNLKMLVVQDGDTIAKGKITSISLDTLDYSTKGQVIHVQVGQNLRGVEAPAAPDATTTPSVPASPVTAGAPAPLASRGTPLPSPVPLPAASGGSTADVVARMKARRASELR
jgi:hypothetical protein